MSGHAVLAELSGAPDVPNTIVAALALAEAVREQSAEDCRDMAQAVSIAAGQDVLAAIIILAALIPIDRPVERWWGGPAPHGRPPGRPLKPPAPCGTFAAYRRHQRAGQKPCQACEDAAARRRGTDCDETNIDLFLSGVKIKLNTAERLHVIRRWHELGLTDRQIGDRIGISRDAVSAARQRDNAKHATPQREVHA